MKRQIAALTLAALLLAGCGRGETPTRPLPAETGPDLPAEAPTEAFLRRPGTLWRIDGMSDFSAYHVVTEYWRDAGADADDVYCVFTCLNQNGSVLWTHESPRSSAGAQVQPIWPLGFLDGRFLYYVQGRVVALEEQTGNPLWESPDTGICLSAPEAALLDYDGFICLGEYFGSNLAVLDLDGNLIREIPTLDPDLYWISSLTRQEDSLVVHLDGGGSDSLSGTDLTVPIDWIP